MQREQYESALAAVARLRRVDQEVLLLSLWEELSHKQIATAVGSTVPAVRQRLHRARRALRREFERISSTLPHPQLLRKEASRDH